jgi:MFS family permease
LWNDLLGLHRVITMKSHSHDGGRKATNNTTKLTPISTRTASLEMTLHISGAFNKLDPSLTPLTAVARFAEPLAYTSVNPYLPAMVRSFGIPHNKVAKWAGLISSVFSLAQSLTAVPWGKAADKYGRKPILITGLLCTMLCFMIWGFSSSLEMAITVRVIQGGSNGNGTFPPCIYIYETVANRIQSALSGP